MLTKGLLTPLQELPIFDMASLLLLKKELGIDSLKRFLEHYPLRYQDRTRFYQVAQVKQGLPFVQLKGRLGAFSLHQLPKAKKMLTSSLTDQSGQIRLGWFNGLPAIQKQLVPGQNYILNGTPSTYKGKVMLLHPEFRAAGWPAERTELSAPRLYPIYPLNATLRKKGVPNRRWISWIEALLAALRDEPLENLPEALRRRYRLVGKYQAWSAIHLPGDAAALHQARRRLKFEELFFFQLRVLQRKKRKERKAVVCKATSSYNRLLLQLPFSLTAAQKRVIEELYKDLASGKQMNRLLQGDVGSGKSIVSLCAMLPVFDQGLQVVCMVPTTILAQQQQQRLESYTKRLGIESALLTAATPAKERANIEKRLASGELKLLVGTHALLEERIGFDQLGMVVIDEQHRFGVAQRAQLWEKAKKGAVPHILVMTATPIPRTLAMSLYGDLNFSRIDQMPEGRLPIRTFHRTEQDRLKVLGFLKKIVSSGKQAYVVYPLVKESNKFAYKDVITGYQALQRYLPKVPMGILYGGMKAEAKIQELERFQKGITKVMVATTVVEVGVDIPDATLMIIENAERFGLSQLHQLRGRVGRGKEQSYCILMTPTPLTPIAAKRMKAMVQTTDGLTLAKLDLKLRGAGNLLGVEQSGLLKLTIADLATDDKIVEVAHQEATQLLRSASLPSEVEAHLELLEKIQPNRQEVS